MKRNAPHRQAFADAVPLPDALIPTTNETEPAINTGGATALVTTFAGLVSMFGFALPDNERVWITFALAVGGPLVVGYLVRRKVFSPKTVSEIIATLNGAVTRAKEAETAVKTQLVVNQAAHAAVLETMQPIISTIAQQQNLSKTSVEQQPESRPQHQPADASSQLPYPPSDGRSWNDPSEAAAHTYGSHHGQTYQPRPPWDQYQPAPSEGQFPLHSSPDG